ncbi:MAG: hypothetical protein Q7T70_02545 [Polaromonas sp.]|nr:hypothetical protein [Polaromonas sp.]
MKTYARVINGVTAQIIPPVVDDLGREVPIEARFTADVLEQLEEYDPLQRIKVADPTHTELVDMATAAIRVQRQPIISVLGDLQTSFIAKGDTDTALVIETAKQGLRDLTDIDLTDCVTFEDMRLKVKARYLELAAALPADIRKEFSEAIH